MSSSKWSLWQIGAVVVGVLIVSLTALGLALPGRTKELVARVKDTANRLMDPDSENGVPARAREVMDRVSSAGAAVRELVVREGSRARG